METDDILLLIAAGAAAFFIYKLINPTQYNKEEAANIVRNAGLSGKRETWFAPMQGKTAILDTSGGRNTTYFIGADDLNLMPRWQRIALSAGISPKLLFGGV